MQITAAYYTGNRSFSVERAAAAPPGPGEVQVDVAFCGICGTDMHVFHGNMDGRVTEAGRTSVSTRYYLSSARLTPEAVARAVRAHWAIENRLHWVLDVTFDEDRPRNRRDNGPENLAIILRRLTSTCSTRPGPRCPPRESESDPDGPTPSPEPSSAKCDSPGIRPRGIA